MTIPDDKLFWLSFADADRPVGQQFLGVVVTRAWSIKAAIVKTHRLGINPGGGVKIVELLDLPAYGRARAIPRDRLLSFAELEALGLKPVRAEGFG